MLLLACTRLHAAADPDLVRAVRALAAREADLKSLSGVVMQHEMQSAAEVAAQRALIAAHVGPLPPGAHMRVAPIEEDGLLATRFAVGPGRCRLETVVYRASLDNWGASTWLLGRDGKVPAVPGAPTPTLIVSEDGQAVTTYRSTSSSASVKAQAAWPTVAERSPLCVDLMLSLAGNRTWSQMLAEMMRAAGQTADGLDTPLTTPSAQHYRSLQRLPDSAVDGQGCMGLEYTWVDTWKGKDALATTRLWMAERYGFAVVRFEASSPRTLVEGTTTTTSRRASQFVQVSPGVWLPQQTVFSTMLTDAAGKQELRRTLVSLFHSLTAQPLDAGEFRARLPLGTYVQDTTGRGPYVVGEVSAQDADGLLQQDRKLWEAPGAPLIPPPAGPKP